MKASARTARQTLRDRARQHRDNRRPHTLASHCLRAGLDASTATSVAGALRAKAKRLSIAGKRSLVTRTVHGRAARKRVAYRFTLAQFLRLAAAYSPRAGRFVAARAVLLGGVA